MSSDLKSKYMKQTNVICITINSFLFLFGLLTSYYLISFVMYLIPLILCFQKNKYLKIYSIWLVAFLLIQSIFPFSLFDFIIQKLINFICKRISFKRFLDSLMVLLWCREGLSTNLLSAYTF